MYSCADLHGKVFLFDGTAIVGSTNVSAKTYTDLHEAALLTREPMAVAAAHEFIEELPKDPVDEKFLKRAEAIYRPPFGSRQLRHQQMDDWILSLMRRLGPVKFRPRMGYFVYLRKKSKAVWHGYVLADIAGSGQGRVTLGLYPGDTISQARAPVFDN